MALNARFVLYVVSLVLILVTLFLWTQSTLSSDAPQITVSSDPIMQQAQRNLIDMHELMHKMQQTQEPDKRRELMHEHMRILEEQLRMMQGMIQGICGMAPVGEDEDEVPTRGVVNRPATGSSYKTAAGFSEMPACRRSNK
jgi:hypothetical protein